MANNSGKVKKVSGYAQKVFYNGGIEYRDFSDNLVGLQFTSDGGSPQFTMGNFSITANIEPTLSKTFNTGTFSDYYCLDEITTEDTTYLTIQNNLKTQLNLDITNPLHYVWYGNFSEYLRVSLNDISNNWAAAIYVDNKVGSISGDNITNYSYNPLSDTSTVVIPTKYFVNPFGIKYTRDASLLNDLEEVNPLRNFTLKYNSYVLDINGVEYIIKELTGSTTTTNDTITVVVEKELLPSVTGNTTSIPYFIKPNEQEREGFFSGLNELQRNLLNRVSNPIYTVDITYPEETDDGIIVLTNSKFTFPILDDGYNLNFFNALYSSYLDDLVEVVDNFDSNQTNLVIRKYTAKIISSFDTAPRCDGDDLTNNGQKATNLLSIYGREFDEVKKYINGIKFSHVVTYNKKDNTPDSLVKDLAWMLGFDKINFLTDINLSKNLLPSNGMVSFSGSPKKLSLSEIDIEVYRRLILNIAWLWKSKGARKAIEFLFRFIGAPESIVVFDEHVYVADKPLDVEQIKRLLYLYTGETDISNLPFDENGYPLPPKNGDLRVVNYIAGEEVQSGVTSEGLPVVLSKFSDIYFQKGGGWYRETGGYNTNFDSNVGNNPHVGRYDAGREYIDYFQDNCYIPGFTPTNTVIFDHIRLQENLFVNYNYGYINGMPTTFDLYVTPLTVDNTNLNQCVNLTASIDNSCPVLSDGTSPSNNLAEICVSALTEYNEWVEKIKEEPYLKYSPEWEIVKKNNQVASNNYFNSVNAGEICNDNTCIEICVDILNQESIEPCEIYTLVEDDSTAPFIYFIDEDGNKACFDEFPVCCVANGGTYKNFLFDNGQEASYCAKSAPCNGLSPMDTNDSGIIVWESVDGSNNGVVEKNDTINYYYEITPKLQPQTQNVYYSGIWYITPLGDTNSIDGDFMFDSSWSQFDVAVNNEWVKPLLVKRIPDNSLVVDANEWDTISSSVNSNTTTDLSPECCVWYGYDFQIQSDNKVACIDRTFQISADQSPSATANFGGLESTNSTTTIDDVKAKRQQANLAKKRYGADSPESILAQRVEETQTKLLMDYRVSLNDPTTHFKSDSTKRVDAYLPGGSDALPSLYSTLSGDYNRLSPAVCLYFTTTDIPKDSSYESNWENPDINNCSVWQPKVDEITGYVSLILTDEQGDTITMPESTEQFKNCCRSKGYTFGCFTLNKSDNTQIPIDCGDVGNNIEKCVDPSFITCEDVGDLKMIFAANEWDGFYLPSVDDGVNCEISITADMMIKYGAEDIIECSSTNNCGFHYSQYKNSLYDTDCLNWITFTKYDNVLDDLRNNKQIVDLNSIVDWDNYNSGDGLDTYPQLEDYQPSQWVPYFDKNNTEIWTTPGLQEEPNVECCEALGGDVVDIENWSNLTNETFNVGNNVNNLFTDLVGKGNSNDAEKDGLELNLSNETISGITTLVDSQIQYNNFADLISCIDFTIFNLTKPDKGYKYSNLITTQQVCQLTVPAECLELSSVLEIYWGLLNQIEISKGELEDCVNKTNSLTSQQIKLTETYSTYSAATITEQENCDTQTALLNEQIDDCTDTISSIENDIDDATNVVYTTYYQSLKIESQGNIQQSCSKLYYNSSQPCTQDEINTYLQSTTNAIDIFKVVGMIATWNQITTWTNQIETETALCDSLNSQLVILQKSCEENINKLTQGTNKILSKLTIINSELGDTNCCITPDSNGMTPFEQLDEIYSQVVTDRQQVISWAESCYEQVNKEREETYTQYLEDKVQAALTYIEELEVCLTLEVDNRIEGNFINPNVKYTTLKEYTTEVWDFDPYSDYTGIIIEGSDTNVNAVKQSVFTKMEEKYGASSVTENTFEPDWKRVTLPISETQLTQLKTMYPEKQFFIGVTIKNIKCDVCVLIDNIQISLETDEIERKFSMENCPTFNLECVIDDKKSWLFSDGEVREVIDVKGVSECNLPELFDSSKIVVKYDSPQQRRWLDLEYRESDYIVNHDDLVLNSKEASFRIDAAKAIECGVYGFWQDIDCTSSACTATTSDCIITGCAYSLSATTIPATPSFSGVCIQEGLPADTDIYVFIDATSVSYENLKILNAHIYKWYHQSVLSGELSDLAEGEEYTGKLRQFLCHGGGIGERWLRYSEFPWEGAIVNGGFTNNTFLDGATFNGGGQSTVIVRDDINTGSYNVITNLKRPSENLLEEYSYVATNTDVTFNTYDDVISVADLLYTNLGNGQWEDPVTGNILNDNEIIKTIPGIVRIDGVNVNGLEYQNQPEDSVWLNNIKQTNTGSFIGWVIDNANAQAPSESNRENVMMVSIFDEANPYYHSAGYPTGVVGDFGSAPLPTYETDFNTFISAYNNYNYFRGYAYSIPGGRKFINPPNGTSIDNGRQIYGLHQYAAVEGEVVPLNDLVEPILWGDGGVYNDDTTFSAITFTNPYSALTATTLEGDNKSGLKNFGWGERHDIPTPWTIQPGQIPLDIKTLIDTTPVPAICVTGGTPEYDTEVCVCQPITINPLDFLDKHPSEVNVKSDMDKMLIANLIDAKSRQVISGYPMLWAFYELYLKASNCGADLTSRLDYDSLFEFTDLIGDYWLDLLEQVIPATTIMDGCQNSGKVYRNNIFDQPKFNYKRYALNYYNSKGKNSQDEICKLTDVTDNGIANKVLSIKLTETPLSGPLYECEQEIRELNKQIELAETNIKISELTEELVAKQKDSINLTRSENVINGFNPDSVFDTIFITQIYDTNEYEGDINVTGDDEWVKCDELIHDCDEGCDN